MHNNCRGHTRLSELVLHARLLHQLLGDLVVADGLLYLLAISVSESLNRRLRRVLLIVHHLLRLHRSGLHGLWIALVDDRLADWSHLNLNFSIIESLSSPACVEEFGTFWVLNLAVVAEHTF